MANLTLRQLNRAVLDRQLLLRRADLPVVDAVEQVAGLQAQVANPPYIGMWSRLNDFKREMLMSAIEARAVVRSTMMRATLHLHTAADYRRMRPILHPGIVRQYNSYSGKRIEGLDADPIVAAGLAALKDGARTFVELRAMLTQIMPDRDVDALANVIRSRLPIVQVYPGGSWGFGGEIRYALPENVIGHPVTVDGEIDPAPLILRYLAAFGPASIADFQAWSGLTRMKAPFERLRPQLITHRDENGRELFDLPEFTIPPQDTPAPVRLMPEYDNLIMSHDQRQRVIADEHRAKVYLSAGRVRATFLIDGFVAGAWKVEKDKKRSALVLEPFIPLTPDDAAALTEEADRLIRWIDPQAPVVEVRLLSPA